MIIENERGTKDEKDEYSQVIKRLYENSYVDLNDCDLLSRLVDEHLELVGLIEKWGLNDLSIKELDEWHDRCIWHVEKCNELHDEINKTLEEECLKSLSALSLGNYCFDNITSKYPYLKYEYDCLFELIDKYFDNPPLKFEELKVDDWVWDNKYKYYGQIYETKKLSNGTSRIICYNDMSNFDFEFEENRFYRKQVEE